MAELGDAVGSEIAYQKSLWAGDFEAAMAAAETVLAKIGNPELRGYRALWHYLAGSAAWLASKEGVPGTADKARLHFSGAKKAANAIPWLISLARYQADAPTSEEKDEAELSIQLERVEEVLEKFGVLHDRAFARREKEILSGLGNPETFENAHKLLGELLGFSAGKVEVDASPDPWWLSSSTCFVFEDHANADPASVLGANKARQAASHPKWMEANVEDSKGLDMLPILVTSVKAATKGAIPHLGTVWLWPLNEFVAWAKNAVSVVREQRRTFVESGDLAWRANAAKAFAENTMDAAGLSKMLKQRPAAELLSESDEVVE
jgi:hypothetical protein